MKKTVLITGASSGLGKTAAKFFAGNGWNVVANMRSPDKEKDLVSFDAMLVTRLDVQERDSINAAIEAGIARFGKIDVLVNNAGFGLFGVFEAISRAKIQEQFNVNVFGVMDVTRAILPHFRKSKIGLILNISSGAGVYCLPMISLYCATKFALEGFSESLAYELASQNIVVKIIELGGVVSTNFGKRSGAEIAHNAPLAAYDAFVAGANTIFAGLRAERRATEEEVAKVIFTATTDGTNQLRYVATNDIVPLAKARRETSELEYMALVRSRFMPKP
jgi:NAD(P)-dependent dehydrogenase (short-subunit alcohol dehydrogenase family)